MEKNEIFDNLLSNIDEVYESIDETYPYIYDEIEQSAVRRFFDKMIKDIYVSDEVLKKLIESHLDFFKDPINIIYLKLSNIYKKLNVSESEKQEIYYIADKFAPIKRSEILNLNQDLLRAWLILKSENKTYNEFVKNIIFEVLKDYKDAIEYGKTKEKTDEVLKTIKLLDEAIVDFETGSYYVDGILKPVDINSDLSEVVIDYDVDIADIYCHHYQTALTDEEKRIVLTELDKQQNEVLFDTFEGKTK